ncbi:MAG TPA: hypothetical protein VJQ56_08230 [Blastocatellia bacterium]|nr:hypothetical protein [Blastocatellia bacterium]
MRAGIFDERFNVYVVAALTGLVAGFIVWLTASHWIAASIARVETRHPHLYHSRRMRAGEVVACGALFFGCLALACWIAYMLAK